ncbi:MAG: M48 family metalloprotease [Anaerovoracaceae bacterium]|jgi:heat shock protein HtpX
MYFFDFMKNLVRKKNICVMIYMIMNVYFISGFLDSTLYMMNYDPDAKASPALYPISFAVSIGLYAVSLMIALSPVGEAMLRFYSRCKKIRRVDQRNYLEPLFREVYGQAKKEAPELSDKIRLYISPDADANAFAIGRNTICVTEGLLSCDPETIKAILAHEFGHLVHHDTDQQLAVSVGNFILDIIFFLIKIFLMIFIFALAGCSRRYYYYDDIDGSGAALLAVICMWPMWLWTKIGMLFVRKSCRESEFEADAFSCRLGYGFALCRFLDTHPEPKLHGMIAALESTHPAVSDRIGRMQEMGVEYYVDYGAQI